MTVTTVNDDPVANTDTRDGGRGQRRQRDRRAGQRHARSRRRRDADGDRGHPGRARHRRRHRRTGVSYTPAANYFGARQLHLHDQRRQRRQRHRDGQRDGDAGQRRPGRERRRATVAEDSGATIIDVLANDTLGPDAGETLTVTAVTQGAHGTVTFTADGTSATRRPPTTSGTDSFTYTISDGNGGTDTATVNVTVTPVNDDPVANRRQRRRSAEDSGATAIAVLANDTIGPDAGETLTVTRGHSGRARHRPRSTPTGRQLHAGRELLRHRQLHLHDQRRQRRHAPRRPSTSR